MTYEEVFQDLLESYVSLERGFEGFNKEKMVRQQTEELYSEMWGNTIRVLKGGGMRRESL